MKFDDEINSTLNSLGEVCQIVLIKESLYRISDVYLVEYQKKYKYILKIFSSISESGSKLFKREILAYKILQDSPLKPHLVASGRNFILLEYCKDTAQEISLSEAIKSIAQFHNIINSVKSSKLYQFDFFGDASFLVDTFLKELDESRRVLFNKTKIRFLIDKITKLLKARSQYLCHADLCRNNLRVDKQIKIIDFECLSNLPLEFDLAFFFSFEMNRTDDISMRISEISDYASFLSFDYKLNYEILLQSLIFDSIRRWRFAKKMRLLDKEQFYFQRLLNQINSQYL